MSKILDKLIGKYIVKPVDEYEYEYVCKYGLQEKGELGKYLHIHFCNFLFKIYSKYDFLRWLLCSLCELEIQLSCLFDKERREDIEMCDCRDIPENTLYCQGCPFADYSKLANFIFGNQSYGYCWYLSKGDFSFYRPTLLLWDGCKECGMNEWDNEDLNDEMGNQ